MNKRIRLKMTGKAGVAFAGLLPDRSAPAGEFGDNRQEDGRCPEAANAPPARNVPAPGTEVRADGSADEVAEHINHVEPAPGARVNAVNAGLIRNVTALHPKIHQDDANDQAG